jgi:hypothetical protein
MGHKWCGDSWVSEEEANERQSNKFWTGVCLLLLGVGIYKLCKAEWVTKEIVIGSILCALSMIRLWPLVAILLGCGVLISVVYFVIWLINKI